MFSATVICGNKRVILEQHADIAAMHRHAGDASVVEKISPAFGSTRPAIMRNVVVLPQPLGPSSATMLPGSIDRDRRSTARVAP